MQKPGKIYVFKTKDGRKIRGRLPNRFGKSNNFAYWQKSKCGKKGGCWISADIAKQRTKIRNAGGGKFGLISRMRWLFKVHIYNAKKENHLPPATTPEQMLIEWENQKGLCAACKLPLNIFKDTRRAHYDHNHKTGETRGFVHGRCNHVEGILKDLPDENLLFYVYWLRPHLKNLKK